MDEKMEVVAPSIPPRNYKKKASVSNAEKARQALAKKREEMKNKPPPPSDDEFSEDEIVYVPTRKNKTIKKPVGGDDSLRLELEEVRKQLELLKSTKEIPKPPEPPKPNPNSDIINMARTRILNF